MLLNWTQYLWQLFYLGRGLELCLHHLFLEITSRDNMKTMNQIILLNHSSKWAITTVSTITQEQTTGSLNTSATLRARLVLRILAFCSSLIRWSYSIENSDQNKRQYQNICLKISFIPSMRVQWRIKKQTTMQMMHWKQGLTNYCRTKNDELARNIVCI